MAFPISPKNRTIHLYHTQTAFFFFFFPRSEFCITCLLDTIQKQHEPGSGAQMTQETADRLSQLQAERALCLQPVKIRISPGDRNAPESNASGENNDQQEANGKKRSADTLSGRRKEIDLQTESASCCDSFVGDTDDNDALRTLALLSKQFKTP